MKYYIFAKFLGTYMPEKKATIGNCTILKSYDQYYLEDDRPAIPTRSKSFEFHQISKPAIQTNSFCILYAAGKYFHDEPGFCRRRKKHEEGS